TRLVARVASRPSASSAGHPLEAYDALIVRIIPDGSLEQIIFRMDVLHRLEDLGIRIMNPPSTIERTVDKYYTSSLLEAHGLPTPRTIVAEGFDEAMEAFREMKDVVVKPLFGAGGLGMVRVSDPDIAYRTFRALELGRYIFYLQEYIPHQDHDIRAFVVGNKVVASMIRRSKGWKHNVARGAKPEPYQLDAEAEALSIKACKVLKADYAGVDLLRSEEGRYFLIEVNSIPGWSGLQKTTSVNIAEEIVNHLMELLTKCKVQR
ncbi:MAG: RimK family alpha-L-glutamate ligase, partial [Candidatus Methylomirabilales bacterium]